MGCNVGWCILSLVVAVVPLLRGWQLLRHALPRSEQLDFQLLGPASRWQLSAVHNLSGPIGGFVRTFVAEPSLAGRIDLLCERLGEVDSETHQIASQYSTMVRAVLAAGGLLSVIIVTSAVRKQAGWEIVWGLLPALLSALVAFWCYWMGQLVSHRSGERRRNWDALCRMLEGPHMSWPAVAGEAHSGGDNVGNRGMDNQRENRSATAPVDPS